MEDSNIEKLRQLAEQLTESESNLERERKLLRAIYDVAISALIVMDSTGMVREWSRVASEIFGYTTEEAVGRQLSDLIVPDSFKTEHKNGLERYRLTGEGPLLGKLLVVTAVNKKGDEFPVELMIKPLDLDTEQLFVGFVRSVKEREQLKADTELLRHLLEEITNDLRLNRRALTSSDILIQEALERIGRNLHRVETLLNEVDHEQLR